MQLNFRDPSIVLRLVIIALSGISLILLIAGTAVDEYVTIGKGKNSMGMGCQKLRTTVLGETILNGRASFKYMSTLSFVIILFTSLLCLLQAAATALNVLVLLQGKYQKQALILSSLLTVLLLAVVIMANVNFDTDELPSQVKSLSMGIAEKEVGDLESKANKLGDKLNSWGDRAAKGYGRRRRFSGYNARAEPDWGPSYALLSVAYSFAILNQILLFACHLMPGGGGLKELGPNFVAWLRDVVAFLKNTVRLVRYLIVIINGLLLLLMVIGTARDRYVGERYTTCGSGTRHGGCSAQNSEPTPFKDMKWLAIFLLGETSLICVLLAIAFVLSVMHLVKEKFAKLLIPILVLSVGSTISLLISLVLACIIFTEKDYPLLVWKISFKCLATSFCFGIVNTALNAFNFVLDRKAKGGAPIFNMSRFSTTNTNTPSSGGVPTTQPSSGGNPPPSQPSSK